MQLQMNWWVRWKPAVGRIKCFNEWEAGSGLYLENHSGWPTEEAFLKDILILFFYTFYCLHFLILCFYVIHNKYQKEKNLKKKIPRFFSYHKHIWTLGTVWELNISCLDSFFFLNQLLQVSKGSFCYESETLWYVESNAVTHICLRLFESFCLWAGRAV